jgi:hypothetical protein
VAVFWADAGAGFTADAVLRRLDHHDHHFIVVIVKVIVVFNDTCTLDQLEHIARADFVTTPTANAGFCV